MRNKKTEAAGWMEHITVIDKKIRCFQRVTRVISKAALIGAFLFETMGRESIRPKEK